MSKVEHDVADIKETVTNSHWQPKDIAVVITAVLSLLTAVGVALINLIGK